MAIMGEKHKAEAISHFENRLRDVRMAKGLSKGTLAGLAGVTRQAVHAIEAGRYLPTTAVALRLADALGCRVEDLFSLAAGGEVMEGELVGAASPAMEGPGRVRVKVARVGERVIVRPVAALGDVLNFTIPADGLMLKAPAGVSRGRGAGGRVRVQLLRDRRAVENEIAVAGCDPSVFLIGEHLRKRQEPTTVVGWTMGSAAAVEALLRREVHVAGLHVLDAKSGESNLPYLRRHLKKGEYTVVTFATWEQGLMVQRGNPKTIRSAADLARKNVSLINREEGAGARLLLDRQLTAAGVKPVEVKGYDQLAGSHLEVARTIAEGRADAGIGVRSAAKMSALDFIPLQEERYDLVMPTAYLSSHRGLSVLLDAIVSRPFRTEIEALGGYGTRETGKVQAL
jgi:molybdate-binding protein/DNA-binding XRE family transcriptional regulator